MELAKLERRRATDDVYDALRHAILSSVLRPGERLNVEDLAVKLGVSLTPVRSAVQRLAAEGLIEIRPRSGTFVASLNTKDIEETFKIRCALECLAAEDAVERIEDRDLRRLHELLRILRKPVRTAEGRAMHERANSELHGILVRASGNARLLEVYEALNAHIKIARVHASESGWSTRLEREQAEHEAIVKALERRDAARVQDALRKHIGRARDALVAAVRQKDA